MERKFNDGDKVRINDSHRYVDDYLQRSNRVGTIVQSISIGYWLKMNKLVINEGSFDKRIVEICRPSIIPYGYAYPAYRCELELISPADAQKLLDPWSIEPPKEKVESQDESIPDVWKERILA